MRFLLLAGTFVALSTPGMAQTIAAPRYQISPAGEGFVRLDTISGAMVFCRVISDAMRCAPVNDGSAPVAGQQPSADDLDGRITALEQKLAELQKNSIPLPSGKDIDTAISAMEKLLQRMLEGAKSLEGPSSL